MADFVDSTVKDIDSRLSELRPEVTKLEAARHALVGGRRGPGRPAASNGSTTARRRRRRGAQDRSSRAAAAAATPAPIRRWTSSASHRGSRSRRSPRQLKIEPNYLYRVMPKLVEDGQVKREGQGWHPAAAA